MTGIQSGREIIYHFIIINRRNTHKNFVDNYGNFVDYQF